MDWCKKYRASRSKICLVSILIWESIQAARAGVKFISPSVFLFWASMIKATRIWGGENKQGIAFGFLDGGRGLVAALFGSVGVLIFSLFITKDIELTSIEERRIAFKQVITYTSYAVIVIGIIVFFFLKLNTKKTLTSEKTSKLITIENFKIVMKYKVVWLLMIIILCAYYGYKMTNLFTQYAEQVMHYDKIESAKVGTYLLYMRPVIGVAIGLLADRTKASLWIIVGFFLMALTSLIFALGIINDSTPLLFVLSIGTMAIGVYSARVLYFATLEETKIPMALTGTAVGFISVIGYTPDIFTGIINGYFLDKYNEDIGHQIVFAIMFGFAIIGCIASYKLFKHSKQKAL